MRTTTLTTGNQLASALYTLGVNFVLGGRDRDSRLLPDPEHLIEALAQSDEARLRLSLIPLFLEYPEYAVHVRKATKGLESTAHLTLQCYYTAAVYLAQKYPMMRIVLPNHFAGELNLQPVDDPDENLRALAKRHQELSQSYVNWFATYQHAERIWRKGKINHE